MQEDDKQLKKPFNIKDLSFEERDNLVGAFAWLIQEDKKQNPDDYKLNNSKKND